MSFPYDINAPKKATNISINSDLIQKAKSYKINLSKTLESELDRLIRNRAEEEWLEETQEAVEEYNRHIAARGAFGDRLRRF